jgi:hypothetical protein
MLNNFNKLIVFFLFSIAIAFLVLYRSKPKNNIGGILEKEPY